MIIQTFFSPLISLLSFLITFTKTLFTSFKFLINRIIRNAGTGILLSF